MNKQLNIRTDERLLEALKVIAEHDKVKFSTLIEELLLEYAKTRVEELGITYLPEQIGTTRKNVEWKLRYRIWMAKDENEGERIGRMFRVDLSTVREIRAGLNPASEVYEKEFGVTLANWEHYQQWRGELNKSLGIQP